MEHTKVLGTGHFVPPRVLTNHDLEKMMDTSDEWIRQRTGIEERRIVEPGVGTSDLGVEAARRAIEDAGLQVPDIEMIIFATLSPDYYFPGSGVLLQHKLGCRNIPALDIRQQCTGFVYGLSVADHFIRAGTYRRILLVGAEVHSKGLNYTTAGRDVACIFGDGAGAVVLGASDEPGILSSHLHSDGEFHVLLWLEKPGSGSPRFMSEGDLDRGAHFPKMEGQAVFKQATRRFCEVIREALDANRQTIEDVDLFVFHQANLRIIEKVAKTLEISPDRIFNNIQKYGNTTAASIPICIDEAVKAGRLKRGGLLCPAAFGSGLTWAASLIRW
jgi:3-oxoacyl-[acyl-carrier-protein] synthase-3